MATETGSSGFQDKRLAILACTGDDVSVMEDALTGASLTNSLRGAKDVLQYSLGLCVRLRAFKVLNYVLDQGADLQAINPSDVAGDEINGLWKEEKTLELLHLLSRRGWHFNSMGQSQRNQSPILWHVTHSPVLVQCCLDNGSKLAIPDEATSLDATKAEIYYTPRHPLLLECVAQYGSVSTFKLLLNKGAPTTPGETWPAWHSPRLLDRAVVGAMQASPVLNEPASAAYKDRLDMVIYLVNEHGVCVNGRRPLKPFHILFQDDAGLLRKPRSEHTLGQDFRDLVKILLDAGANLTNCGSPRYSLRGPLVDPTEDDRDIEEEAEKSVLVSPMTRLYLWHPARFWLSVKRWQHENRDITNRDSLIPGRSFFALSKLPHELVAEIGACLNFLDVSAMRLVSRFISNCMDKAFQHQVRTRRVELRPSVLQNLIDQLLRGELICRVEEVILKPRIVYETGYDNLVQELLSHFLKTAALHGKLHSIQIKEKSICRKLNIILDAISSSGIALQSLSLYPGSGMYCAPSHFYPSIALQNLNQSLKGLKRFHWSLTVDGYLRGNKPRSKRTVDTGRLVLGAISELLDMMPRLESLDLFWFKKYPVGRAEQYFFKVCYTSILAMKSLRTIGLAGLDLNEENLHLFLNSTTAKCVTFKECRLVHGSWRSIFDSLTDGSFDYFHLDELYEADTRLSFDVPGYEKLPTSDANSGPTEIIREGRETSTRFTYRPSGQISNSTDSLRFQTERTRVYGSDKLREPSIGARAESP